MQVRNLIDVRDPILLRHAPFMTLVDDALSAGECATFVERIEALSPAFAPITTARGFVDRPEIRNNDRVMFDDTELATRLFDRLRPILPERMHDRADPLEPVGLNERFRGYRYRPGHRFAPHFDGSFVRSAHERSELTVLFYLNDGFVGGSTSFCDWEVTVVPRRGQALLFYHPVRHEGCVVESGTKYVLRTDVMYRGHA